MLLRWKNSVVTTTTAFMAPITRKSISSVKRCHHHSMGRNGKPTRPTLDPYRQRLPQLIPQPQGYYLSNSNHNNNNNNNTEEKKQPKQFPSQPEPPLLLSQEEYFQALSARSTPPSSSISSSKRVTRTTQKKATTPHLQAFKNESKSIVGTQPKQPPQGKVDQNSPSSLLHVVKANHQDLSKSTNPIHDDDDKDDEHAMVVPTSITATATLAPTTEADNKDAAVAELLSSLTDPTWKDALQDAIQSPSFFKLALFLQEERKRGMVIYPPPQDIFAALNLCPLDKVQVVIVGQDPYHGPHQGHGLAFSVRRGIRPPPSLRNIFKEAGVVISSNSHGCLESWAQQGVLLLNTVLTVRQGQANSHAHHGWEEFTDAVIQVLQQPPPPQARRRLVFLLWGKPAHLKARGLIEDERHMVICTSHPSPLGATKTSSPFLGSRCFERANEALERWGRKPIDWSLPQE
jgi:uracil-DNA glycosylase